MDPFSGFVDKAKALLTLRTALGPLYDSQKQLLIDQLLSLPLTDAAQIMSKFIEISFIDATELATLTSRLLGTSQALVPKPTEQKPQAPTSPPKDPWVDIKPETKLSTMIAILTDHTKIDQEALSDLIGLLATCDVLTVNQALEFEERDKQLNIIEEIMGYDQAQNFKKVVLPFKELPYVKAEIARKKEEQQIHQQVYNLWNNDVQAIFVPVRSELHFFCTFEVTHKEGEDRKGEHLIFCLDVSASMNHDENGKYQVPKSVDHPHSSIKKARELIPPLAMAALKRHTPVTLVVWSQQIKAVIEFKPSEFIDPESGEFQDDTTMEEQLKIRSNDTVFRASGGTNLEAALRYTGESLLKMAPNLSNVIIWFLTDGEETFCLKNGTAERIPNSKADKEYAYYNTPGPDSLTPYQKSLVRYVGELHSKLMEMNCTMEFHACHFGEAHPIFLGTLRKATDGHFHAVADIDKLKQEMTTQATTSHYTLRIIEPTTGRKYEIPSTVSEGSIFSRGIVPFSLLTEEILRSHKIIISFQKSEFILDGFFTENMSQIFSEGISSILMLEPCLGEIISQVSETISISGITSASQRLTELRKTRADTIPVVAKLVSNGSMIQIFLEKVLESVETQINALERMLSQHLRPESQRYDAVTAKTAEFFNQREQLAIAAGLESMRVRLGNGFVAKSNLDRRIQRLMAQHGPWARTMLARKCLLGETPRGDRTRVTLVIVEGHTYKSVRNDLVRRLANADVKGRDLVGCPSTKTTVEESFFHDPDRPGDVLCSRIVVTLRGGEGGFEGVVVCLKEVVPTEELYTPVDSYTCDVFTDDLEEATDRMRDPLSFCSFMDLIRDNNTLPAYLYTVASDQSIGIIFNAKEMLQVYSGGSECTSFGYFRLYWRLAEKITENGIEGVKVPGHFKSANSALPVAPEPLTNKVLSNLMPGLISEFITGTPIAPLPEIGILYIGYLLMHMRSEMTGVDATRIAEILSTIRCWIENPKTRPKLEEVEEMMFMLVKNKGISSGDSPGKYFPVRAFAMGLVDEKFPPEEKFEALVLETWRRNFKILCGKIKGNTNQKINPKIKENQISARKFVRKILTQLSENTKIPPNTDPDIPIHQIEIAKLLKKISEISENTSELLNILSDQKQLGILLRNISEVIHEIGRKAFSRNYQWSSLIRLYYVWHVLAEYPITDLKATFSAFKAPTAFETHVFNGTEILKKKGGDNLFKNTLFPYLVRNSGKTEFCTIDLMENNIPHLVNLTHGTTRALLPTDKEVLIKLGVYVREALNLWGWKGRPSNGYGLFPVDYDVVRALKDPSGMLIEDLSQGLLSEYHAAREWRNKKYEKWAPPKPVAIALKKEDHTVFSQPARVQTEKPRLGLVIIGNVDSGKSTTTGHLISDLGFLDERVIKEYERECRSIGREMMKYAWVMDLLKQERELGLTIEVGLWNISSKNFEIDLLDAPGHKNFVKNMAVGASLADLAILIVSAAPEEFEAGILKGGMTREEALIAYACGVRQFIVAVNKMDVVDYKQARFQEVSGEITEILKKYGISSERILTIPMSGYYGDNLTTPSKDPRLSWWTGCPVKVEGGGPPVMVKTLLEAVDSFPLPKRPVDLPLRVILKQSYKVKGVGTVALGRVVSGTLRPGDTVRIDPSGDDTGTLVQVGTIEIVHTRRQAAVAGDFFAVQVKNVKEDFVLRGMVLSDPKNKPAGRVTRFTAQVVLLSHPGELKLGYSPIFHCHTCTFPGKWVQLIHKLDKKNISKIIEENPPSLRQNDVAIIVVEPMVPTVVDTFAEFPPLGRFVMRDNLVTVGFGIIKSVERYVKEKKKPTSVPVKYLKK